MREADPSEYEQAWTVQEDAFLEWSVRDRDSFEDWQAEITGRPGFEPWNLRVVVDPDGAVVAMAWVQLGDASRRSSPGSPPGRTSAAAAWRRRCSSTRSRSARAHGATRSELSTDSRTGALASTRRSAWSSPRPG